MLKNGDAEMDIVMNASPLILLSKIDRLQLLNKLYCTVYIPLGMVFLLVTHLLCQVPVEMLSRFPKQPRWGCGEVKAA